MDYLALRRTYPLYPSGNEISWNLLVKKVYPIELLIDTSYIKERKKENLDISLYQRLLSPSNRQFSRRVLKN